ncbi:pyridoxal phosphate-dependent aminotransferase [Candidatus Bipolaricaulota bacterium]|nr:pyridoxal phosphate-dependent aminotransferase [Candidatus Bipolaricaulota bacterium]
MTDKQFDERVDRTGTNSVKWDYRDEIFGRSDVLPMWVADSDWPTSGQVIDAIVERAKHGVFGYTKPGEETDELVVNWWKKRYGWEVDPSWIVYTNGVVPALSMVIESFVRPGEGVVLQPPVYYPFFTSVERGGSQILSNELKMENGRYRMDHDNLRELCNDSDGSIPASPPPTMMVLCNPHNPVGRVWTKKELERLADICLEKDVMMVSDDIHSEFIYEGHNYTPIASLSEEVAKHSITLTSPSKAFNTAGLPASVAIIPDETIRSRFKVAQNKVLKNPSVFGLEALMAAYRDGEKWLNAQIAYLQENMEFSYGFAKEKIPLVNPVKPEGTILLWLDFRPLGLEKEELEDLMVNKARVGLDFGHWFGPGGEGFVRLNFACPRSTLEEGLERISRAVKSKT